MLYFINFYHFKLSIQNQADLEIASAVNSIDLINGNHSMHHQTHQPSTYNLNSTSINNSQTKQLNSISNDNSHLQSVHLVNNSNDHHLNSISSLTSSNLTHQLVTNPNHSSNHYMIHVSNSNNQESQITIEPMSNNVQQMHSNTNACPFSNEITQLTNLNTSNGVLNLDGSNINLATLSNGQLNEGCLITSDNDLCWNSLLTDELRLVDSISSYATNTTVTSVPITTSNQTQIVHNPVLDTQSNPICTINSSLSGTINGSLTNTISNSIGNSLQVNSSNLLSNDAQLNQNLILNSTTNQTSTNNFIATSNVNAFTNQLDNQLHLNSAQVVNGNNVVTCVNNQTATSINSSINNGNWDANANYMNLTYNRLNGQLNQTNDLNSSSMNDNQNSSIVIQLNSNGLNSDLNTNHFDNSNSIPTWIECTLQNGKGFETSNAFDLDNFAELDNCTTY